MEKKMEKKAMKIWGRYGPEFMQWIQSEEVAAKHAHEEKMMKSKKGQALMREIRHTWEDAQHVHWAAGFDQDGYAEWIKNEDVKMMFEDIYAIKEALKALVESPMLKKNMELGMTALGNPHFQKMQAMFFEDLGIKSWDELEAKLYKIGYQIYGKMKKCPKLKKLFRQVMRLVELAERSKEVFDMPDMGKVEAWWKKNDFQPWM